MNIINTSSSDSDGPTRTSAGVMDVRRANDRGRTDITWLQSWHSFSFGSYFDPDRIAFRALRVLNDDVVRPGRGFGKHGHDNMEIISWVLDGELAHADSTGKEGVLRPGEAQVMSAGSGILHSEKNASNAKPVHFLQIWIEPALRDVKPRYDQKAFPIEGRLGRWQTIASPDGRDGSLPIHQDALVQIAELKPGMRLTMNLAEERFGYVHAAFGSLRIGDLTLSAGDAITLAGPVAVMIEASDPSQVLFFDLA